MDTPKPKKGCEITEVGKGDINKTGYDEDAAKFMANPSKGFWNTIYKIFNIKKEAP